MKVLVLFAHPVLERSRVNAVLVDAIRDLPGVTLRDLYEEYPTFAIDVAREKTLLSAHDVIVFQHPFYWYSTPAILKEWQDLVLEHGWAYGENGTALHGKITFNAVTTGGPASAYQRGGYNRFTMRELLAPYDQTANLCGMRYLPPFCVHASLLLDDERDVMPHARAYRRLLAAFVADNIDVARAANLDTLNPVVDDLPEDDGPGWGRE